MKTPPTQEKTMEWEKEFDSNFKDSLWSDADSLAINMEDKVKYFIKSLLTSSQDSFRRKVEEEVIGADMEQVSGKHMDDFKYPQAKIINTLKAEQRAKLINIK